MRGEQGRMQKEINRVLQFDAEFERADEERIVMSGVVYWIEQIIGCMLMLVPFDMSGSDRVIPVICFMLLGMAVIFRLEPYVHLKNKGRIERVLERTPMDMTAFRTVRCQYLRRYLAKVGVAVFALQQLSAFFDGSYRISNILYPAVMLVGLYVLGLLYIGRWRIRWYAIPVCGVLLLAVLILWPVQISIQPAEGQTEILIEKSCMGNRGGKPFVELYTVKLTTGSEKYREVVDFLEKYNYHISILPPDFLKKLAGSQNEGNYRERVEYRVIVKDGFYFVKDEGSLYDYNNRYAMYGGKKTVQEIIEGLEELLVGTWESK